MTETELSRLKERVEELEQRVTELETQPKTEYQASGLDHRDKNVLASLEIGQPVGPRMIVKRYKTVTDIMDTGKAKNRAKHLLHNTPFFENKRGKKVFTGGNNE